MNDDPRISFLDKAIIRQIKSLPYVMRTADMFKCNLKNEIKKGMIEMIGDNQVDDGMESYNKGVNDTKNNLRELIKEL